MDFGVSPTKLAVARVLIFGILAVDAVLQIAHAPRYGAGAFNVAHFRFLDGLAPGRVGMMLAQLTIAYCCGLVAFGRAPRVALPVATALYAWVYFTSQLDSYQHHYLVALLLLISNFVPWDASPPPPPERGKPLPPRIASWAVRLILVQLAIMYGWAAISKMDGRWLDGSTMAAQIKTGAAHAIISHTGGFKVAAVLTLLLELTLAATIWSRRGAWIAAPIGILFHVLIALSDLEIGLFAYIMIAVYVLVLPDRLFAQLDAPEPPQPIRPSRPYVGPVALAAALVVSVLIARGTHLDRTVTIALVVAPILLAVTVWLARSTPATWPRLAAAHVLAFALIVAADRGSDTAIDYYRFWGGSASRLGDATTARAAYTRILEFAPDNGNAAFQLGRLELAAGNRDAATRLLTRAVALETHRAGPALALAGLRLATGDRVGAEALLTTAIAAQPSHPGIAKLRAQLAGAAPIAAEPDDDAP